MRSSARMWVLVLAAICSPCLVHGQDPADPAPVAEETPAVATTAPEPDTPDPSGAWTWERDFGGQVAQMTLDLKWEKDELTGEYESFGVPTAIKDAKYENGKLTFTVERDFNGNLFAVDFEGEPSHDEIKGSVNVDFNGDTRAYDWTAKRRLVAEDVIGTWKLRIEGRGGRVMEPTVEITQKNADLHAVFSSRFGDRDANVIKIEDGKLVIEISGEGPRGGTFESVYQGVVRGDKISGTSEFKFGDRAGEVEFTGALEKPDGQGANAPPEPAE